MEPTLIAIIISAAVLAFPLLKSTWDKLNGPATAAPQQIAPGDKPIPAVQNTPNPCVNRLLQFAACLPEEERKELVQRYAAPLLMEELK